MSKKLVPISDYFLSNEYAVFVYSSAGSFTSYFMEKINSNDEESIFWLFSKYVARVCYDSYIEFENPLSFCPLSTLYESHPNRRIDISQFINSKQALRHTSNKKRIFLNKVKRIFIPILIITLSVLIISAVYQRVIVISDRVSDYDNLFCCDIEQVGGKQCF